jgi:hypothetical protein
MRGKGHRCQGNSEGSRPEGEARYRAEKLIGRARRVFQSLRSDRSDGIAARPTKLCRLAPHSRKARSPWPLS